MGQQGVAQLPGVLCLGAGLGVVRSHLGVNVLGQFEHLPSSLQVRRILFIFRRFIGVHGIVVVRLFDLLHIVFILLLLFLVVIEVVLGMPVHELVNLLFVSFEVLLKSLHDLHTNFFLLF